MNEKKIIAVIGAPRSGKTFLVKKLASILNFCPFFEGHSGEIPRFLEEDIKKNQNSLRRILWFRNMQINHFLEATRLKIAHGIVLDQFWIDYQMYIDVLLDKSEKSIVDEMAQIDLKILQWPNIIIYLKNDDENTKKFVKLGGRNFDTGDFYEKIIKPIQKKYEKIFFLIPPTVKLITIERSKIDFSRKKDISDLISKIKKI